MKKKTLILALAVFLLMSSAAAQCSMFAAGSSYEKICTAVMYAACIIIRILQAIATAVASLVLVYNGARWIWSGSFEDGEGPQMRAEAKQRMYYAFAGLALVAVATGLVNYLFSGTPLTFTLTC